MQINKNITQVQDKFIQKHTICLKSITQVLGCHQRRLNKIRGGRAETRNSHVGCGGVTRNEGRRPECEPKAKPKAARGLGTAQGVQGTKAPENPAISRF